MGELTGTFWIISTARPFFRNNSECPPSLSAELQSYGDGIRLTNDKGKPRVVKFADEGNTDVVGATLSYAINQIAS
jgi:hypothetical protein